MRGGASAADVTILGTVVAILALSVVVVSFPPAAPPGSSVRVFGLVSTMGAGTHPSEMVFTDAESGQVAVAQVSDGGYSIQLPNHRMYNVTVNWGGNYTWQTGGVDLGSMSVDMSEGSMMAQSYNVAQPTPDSEVTVGGSISWQMVTAQPTAVRFTAADGETFEAGVTGLSFSRALPNLMTYEVQIQATNSTGYSEWYDFHELAVFAGTSVLGLTVRLGA